jgi:uncharacterized membrane protein YheB (UPF0754 family)
MTIPEWVKEASIPVVSAIVGYGTNVVALQMTFYPVDFFGIKIWQPEDQPLGFCGWQGIVPAKAGKMAAKSVDLMTEQLIDVKDVFSRLDPWEMSEALKPGMRKMLVNIIYDVAREQIPTIWEYLPESVKDEIIEKSLEQSPMFVAALMDDIQENIYEVFDIKHMVVEAMTEDRALLNKVFLEVGAKELTVSSSLAVHTLIPHLPCSF